MSAFGIFLCESPISALLSEFIVDTTEPFFISLLFTVALHKLNKSKLSARETQSATTQRKS